MIENAFIDLDDEERKILEDYEKGEYRSVDNLEEEKALFSKIAKDYLDKKAKINIRISKSDLLKLKRKSLKAGIPYQTLISSLIHQFVEGKIKLEI